jgi:hypothetical protein
LGVETAERFVFLTFINSFTGPQWNNANVQAIANFVQQRSQDMFGEEFEIVVGIGDFVTASHFYKDLLCKIEREGRYILAYATPQNDTEFFDEGISGFPSIYNPRDYISGSLSSNSNYASYPQSRQGLNTCDERTSANLNERYFENAVNPYLLNKYTHTDVRVGNRVTPFRI